MEKITNLKFSFSHVIDYFLLLLIIALTGFEFFFRSVELVYFVLAPISILLFLFRRFRISKSFVYFILIFLLWAIPQYYLNFTEFFAIFNLLIRLIIYYLLASLLRDNFSKYFVNIIVSISLVSLFFYISINLSSDIYKLLLSISSGLKSIGSGINHDTSTNYGQSLVLYYIPYNNIFRNSGPFWEPGMFAVFINIALAINIIKLNKIKSKSTYFLLITSITTLSTTGIIATLFILIFYYIFIRPNFKSILVIFIILSSSLLFFQSEYGVSKINSQFADNDKSYSRFGAILYHLDIIKTYPITGIGYDSNNFSKIEKLISPNGITNIFIIWGIPFALYFYILYYRFSKLIVRNLSFHKVNHTKAYIVLLFTTLLIVAFSQDVTTRHFYYFIAMFPLTYQTKCFK